MKVDVDHKISEIYKIVDVLGRGESSEVYRAKHRETGEFVALKRVHIKDENAKALISEEVKVWQRIQHPFFTHLVDCIHGDRDIYLATEIAEGGELFDRICAKGFYTEADASHTIRQILIAVKYLHSQGIVHRDLKPENILYATKDSNSDIKISDFGMSKIKEDGDADFLMQTRVGTPGYVAPEVINGEGYTKAIDMWSVGVICFILLCGYQPFSGNTIFKVYRQIREAKYEFQSPYWDNISEEAKDLIRKLLVVDASQRLTAEDALKHQWVEGATGTEDILDSVKKQMKNTFRHKWKAAINATIAAARFKLATYPSGIDVGGGEEDSDGDKSLSSYKREETSEKEIIEKAISALKNNNTQDALGILEFRLHVIEQKEQLQRMQTATPPIGIHHSVSDPQSQLSLLKVETEQSRNNPK